ncbi:Lipoprotein NlpE [Saliniradius amylolyticus]|uniref:Lipoprotein NlpE n=1 Tax=Saliniradius amylolyticus TaxID=2183582 RepID=A0A2S2E2A5_9ALTE|nr:META domain-containing protein [Saliniradius amylolyticus]AWL11786.1 Lipoprotein NlpE [Saliniradius amylolyticus]
MKNLLVPFVLILGLTGCSTFVSESDKASSSQSAESPVVDDRAHNSQNSVDWAGTYHGVLPCADCMGTDTLLTLNPDLTYTMETRYIGTGDGWQRQGGHFAWSDNGSVVTLKDLENAPGLYQVTENQLYHLTEEGHRVSGALAEHYRLAKQHGQLPKIKGIKWVLMELNGQSVDVEGKQPFFRIHPETLQLAGIAGCNRFFGQFSEDAPGKVSFGQLGSTMMACPNMQVEQAFLEALKKADNLTRKGNQLSLNKGRMAPLARFEAAIRFN